MSVHFVKRFLSSRLFLLMVFVLLGGIAFFTLSQNKSKEVASLETQVIPNTPYVSAVGTKLYTHGQEYQFVGINAFHLGTYPGVNAGCGGYVSDLDAFFSQLRPNAAVRVWAFQGSITMHTVTKKVDWTGLDRVVNAAQRNGKKLILVLGDQAGACDDGHWKDRAWYEGGFRQAFNDYGNGLTPLPYLDYVKLVVARYKDSTTIAMWEPLNEASAADCTNAKGTACYAKQSCVDEQAAARALRLFFDTVGGAIKAIDRNHPISSGVIGDGQCGAIYEDYKYVHESNGIDVASYHDYGRESQPMPGDQWNGLQKRLDQMRILNKPLIVGEVGMIANGVGVGCMSHAVRKDKMKAKMDAQFTAGIAGFIPWALTGGVSTSCNYDIVTNDPLLSLLWTYPVAMGASAPITSATPFPSPTPTPIDTQAPTAPTNLRVTNLTATQITLTWDAAADNVGVVRYDIFRNDSYFTSTTATSFSTSNFVPATRYIFHVKAKDAVGFSSGSSNRVIVTTQ